ncbi:family 43 glycosylhydrolase [Hymenobacter caeli]|uniref:GH43 family beta-xylosidase n=1 Tax=Hymenobacter caeli TaxID=2735894 RepID=A0ABX2FQJ9_9BACT|nr:family 43 glycosylhydrolase [Hymenobacter caeli]NRT19448.1 GH43 family beta-xylosidase [Hymenobacter caeli]
MTTTTFCRLLAALALLGPAPLGARAQAPAAAPAAAANPVLPGDFPDPSVTKIGSTYWATATSSNWGPVFPLLKSTNLTDWTLVGSVFPDRPPTWADHYFWAPEISQDGGKTYIFYTAHRRGGNLCVGVASADRPEGPYRDHGPLVGQPDGSIDAFPVRDEKGQPYLVWKEDGNSIGQPTPIWAQPLNAARTALTGPRTELFRNTAPWEGNLVEGVSLVRHGGYFYAFYAANGCCGGGCTYATGVARARTLLGPWEKYARNPVLTQNAAWKCPGHGTAVERNGRWYLLHHAYAAAPGSEMVGRQGLLSEFTWSTGGWPVFAGGAGGGPGTAPARPAPPVRDGFDGTALGLAWQWPVEYPPAAAVGGGQLHLSARPDHGGAALGHTIYAADYDATATLLHPAALPAGTAAGLAALGDPDNALALLAGDGRLRLVRRAKGQEEVLLETALPAGAGPLGLRLQARRSTRFAFAYSTDGGATWRPLVPPGSPDVSGAYLPPWDRGIRVGVLAQGPATAVADFDGFTLTGQP